MKALILAAGKGTRLKPLTDNIPKALVPVAGIPMIDYVIKNLINAGINNIAVNLHHLGNYIKNYLPQKYPKVNFYFSDENDKLLDTGGAIKKLSAFLRNDNKPFIVHNVDILTNLNLTDLINFHIKSNNTVTIAVKNRNTSRYLLFNNNNLLCGWENNKTNEKILLDNKTNNIKKLAFSGIQVISPDIFENMPDKEVFSVIDLYLKLATYLKITAYIHNNDFWFDLGKKETIQEAEKFLFTINNKLLNM